MKYLIYNDTRPEKHYGCSYVVNTIIDNGLKRGWECLGTRPVGAGVSWARDLGLIESADMIIINGEGTVHDDQMSCLPLAVLAVEMMRMKKRCILMNASVFNCSQTVVSMFSSCDRLYLRDTDSLEKFCSDRAEYCPDLVFFGEWSEVGKNNKDFTNVLVTDSVLDHETLLLLHCCANIKARYWPVKNLGGHKKYSLLKRYLASYGISFSDLYALWPFVIRSEYEDFENELAQCSFLVSGRYHAIVSSIRLGIPFLYLPSNTTKIQSTLKDIGLQVDRRVLSDFRDIDFSEFRYTDEELSNIDEFSARSGRLISNMFDDVFY